MHLIQLGLIMKTSKCLLIIFPLLILTALAGCGSAEITAPTSSQGPTGEPIVIEGTVASEVFSTNNLTARGKYNGKVVQYTGFVSGVNGNVDNFHIQLSDPQWFGTSFQCDASKVDGPAVTTGQLVTVKGTFNDAAKTMIELEDCSVVKKVSQEE